jgi:hydroxymethylbilane synthase
MRPDLKIVPIRGNVGTRLKKLADNAELDALVLAAAGLVRLHFLANGRLQGEEIPEGLLLTFFGTDQMIPCVGQAAIGIETRIGDERASLICGRLNHFETSVCVRAERSFLQAMGGGCLSPVAAFAESTGIGVRLRAISFRDETVRRGELVGLVSDAETLGRQLAMQLGC